MTEALRVTNLSRSFGGLRATADVSFSVQSGTVCALIGPNGAGKTTLFNLITNLFPADSGQVLLYGQKLTGVPTARIAAMGLIRTFQTARVFPGLTVLENVLAGRHLLLRHGMLANMLRLPVARREERELRLRAMRLLRVVGLGHLADSHAVLLPMGAQKLLEVIRALMAQPRLLLLDEPAAGLNDTETEELAALLRAIRESGITVLIVEHNMSLVMNVADQVVVLEAGSLIAEGTPAADPGQFSCHFRLSRTGDGGVMLQVRGLSLGYGGDAVLQSIEPRAAARRDRHPRGRQRGGQIDPRKRHFRADAAHAGQDPVRRPQHHRPQPGRAPAPRHRPRPRGAGRSLPG